MSCRQESRSPTRGYVLSDYTSAYATIFLTCLIFRIETAFHHLSTANARQIESAQDAIYLAYSIHQLDSAVAEQTAIINQLADSATAFYTLLAAVQVHGTEIFVYLLLKASNMSLQDARYIVALWVARLGEWARRLGTADAVAAMIRDLRENLRANAEYQREDLTRNGEDDEDSDEESGEDEGGDEEDGDGEQDEMAADD